MGVGWPARIAFAVVFGLFLGIFVMVAGDLSYRSGREPARPIPEPVLPRAA